jgi:hypothetical protein
MFLRDQRVTWGIAALLLILVAGCSQIAGNYEGQVLFDDGSPVQSGSIEFRSLSDNARYASRISSDGSFKLTNQDGVLGCPPGEYEVVVVQIVLTEDLAAEDHQHGRTVPRKYADYYTSGLRATNADVPNTPIQITIATDP